MRLVMRPARDSESVSESSLEVPVWVIDIDTLVNGAPGGNLRSIFVVREVRPSYAIVGVLRPARRVTSNGRPVVELAVRHRPGQVAQAADEPVNDAPRLPHACRRRGGLLQHLLDGAHPVLDVRDLLLIVRARRLALRVDVEWRGHTADRHVGEPQRADCRGR